MGCSICPFSAYHLDDHDDNNDGYENSGGSTQEESNPLMVHNDETAMTVSPINGVVERLLNTSNDMTRLTREQLITFIVLEARTHGWDLDGDHVPYEYFRNLMENKNLAVYCYCDRLDNDEKQEWTRKISLEKLAIKKLMEKNKIITDESGFIKNEFIHDSIKLNKWDKIDFESLNDINNDHVNIYQITLHPKTNIQDYIAMIEKDESFDYFRKYSLTKLVEKMAQFTGWCLMKPQINKEGITFFIGAQVARYGWDPSNLRLINFQIYLEKPRQMVVDLIYEARKYQREECGKEYESDTIKKLIATDEIKIDEFGFILTADYRSDEFGIELNQYDQIELSSLNEKECVIYKIDLANNFGIIEEMK